MTILSDEEPMHLLWWVRQGQHDPSAMVRCYFPEFGVEEGKCCIGFWYIFYSGEPCNTHTIELEFYKMLRGNDFLLRQGTAGDP
jgi:hypothetical protein